MRKRYWKWIWHTMRKSVNSKNKIPFAGTHKANEIEGGPNKHMEKNVKDRYE